MHSGFAALREACPMNLRTAYADSQPSDAVLADVARLEVIWAWAREACGSDTPWLCGDYCAADAFFAPVAARLAGYSLPMSEMAQAYVTAHLTDPAFQKWRALGLEIGETLPWYKKDYPVKDWPA
jgi:glutathione S-transferase